MSSHKLFNNEIKLSGDEHNPMLIPWTLTILTPHHIQQAQHVASSGSYLLRVGLAPNMNPNHKS